MLATRGDRCHYCPTELSLDQGTWDHVIAFDKGGTNEITNIVRCCTSCQRRKHTKSPEEYDAHRVLMVTCALPGCNVTYQPRWAEYKRGMARYCSHAHAGAARWL
jgi:5-methylcytosine-specific restriction endonuclease McrA